MSNKVFDTEISGLPDLELKVDPAIMVDPTRDQKEGDELILPDEDEDVKKEMAMKTSEIFVMRKKKMKEQNIKLEVERKIPETKKESLPLNVENEETQFKVDLDPEDEKPKRGKRGNDKKPRKKRVMTEKQKENLRKAREKSLAVRRAKKEAKLAKKKNKNIEQKKESPVERVQNTQPIPVPQTQYQAPMSFDYFCDLMDRYESRKLKKHATTREPHPNKVIPHQAKPRPPVQKVERNIVNVRQPPTSFDAMRILKQGNGNLFGSAFGY